MNIEISNYKSIIKTKIEIKKGLNILIGPNGAGKTTSFYMVCGLTDATEGQVFLDNEDGSNDVYIVKDATIPAGSSLEVMSGNKLVVQNDGSNADVLRVESSRASSLDATITVLEDV